jgi:hypothetical protein
MRRIAIAGTLALGLVAPLADIAAAGGAVFNFEREYYAPGDRVTERVTFGRGSGEPIRAEAGPFTAYLVPGSVWLEEPPIPSSAIPVGEMRLARSPIRGWVATVDFTLPEVAPGTYSIAFCNDPCTVSIMGELTGGWFQVAPSHDVIPLYESKDRLQERVRALGGKVAAVDRRNDSLAHEVSVLGDANRALEERLAQVERAKRPDPGPVGDVPAPLGWGLVGLTIVFGLLMFRPRRRRAPVVNGTVEPPLVEWIEPSDREPALRR